MNFSELGTSPELIALLENRGIKNPSEIQKLVFSPIVEGKSVLGLSKTGSGKTLAYLLPLVQNTLKALSSGGAVQNDAEKSRVLVLCPTRELAHQIHSEIQILMPEVKGASVLIVGGDSESEQLKGFASSFFMVATPGRLLDLIKNSGLSLNSVHRVVLDEADRLLDMGFQEDIQDILRRVPRGFQIVCLSATLHLGVEELIFEMGVDFERVNASSDADLTVEGLDHRVAFVGDQEKFHFLANFLKDRQDQRGIVFSNFRESAHRISKRLEGLGYRAEALSAQLSQPQRRKIMEDFRANRLDILVASDVAARGLDVDALDFVVNFELPDDSATYVHRVGRTARAGRKGVAVSLVGFEDSFRLEKLESYLKIPIERFAVDHSWLEGALPRGSHSPSVRRESTAPKSHSAPAQGRRPHAASSQSRAPSTSTVKSATNSVVATQPVKKSLIQKAWSKVLGLFGVQSSPEKRSENHNSGRTEVRGASSAAPAGEKKAHHHRQSRHGGGRNNHRRPHGRGGAPRNGRRDDRRPDRPAGDRPPRRDGDR